MDTLLFSAWSFFQPSNMLPPLKNCKSPFPSKTTTKLSLRFPAWPLRRASLLFPFRLVTLNCLFPGSVRPLWPLPEPGQRFCPLFADGGVGNSPWQHSLQGPPLFPKILIPEARPVSSFEGPITRSVQNIPWPIFPPH